MIAVRLMGGLGNQMFQYALARKLATIHHTRPVMDIVFLENTIDIDTPREYELDCFKLQANFLDELKRPQEPEPVYAGKKGKLRFIKHKLQGKAWHIYREPHHHFDPKVLHVKDNTYLIGFWQTEKYFVDIRPTLLNDFSFKNVPTGNNARLLAEIQNRPSISLHVRRGDYVSNKHAKEFHGLKGMDYYKKALKEVLQRQPGNYTLYVFSDDLNWCKKNIKMPVNTIYVEGNKKGFEDMRLMMSCTHNIIANSSFSWWAAWLNQNKNKIIVGPQQWFNEPSVNTKDVLPESWVKI